MRTFNMFASRLHFLVNNLCSFAKTDILSDFKCVFFTVVLKICQVLFSHNYTALSLINYP